MSVSSATAYPVVAETGKNDRYGQLVSGSVVVMSALEAEIRHLRARMEEANAVELGNLQGWSGTIDERDVVLVRAGLGKVATGLAVGLAWERFAPKAFVFSGVAGGLAPELAIGDIVIAERTIQHDTGVIGPGGLERYQAGHIPFFNPTDTYGYEPPAELLARVRESLHGLTLHPVLGRAPSISFGTIITGDQYLHDGATRQEFHETFGAMAIEMEGAAMAQAASSLGTDHLVVRVLSDLAGSDSVSDFGAYASQVSVNNALVVRRILGVV